MVMENRPDYCVECSKRGHVRSECGSNPDNQKVTKQLVDGGSGRRRQVAGSRLQGVVPKKVWKPTGNVFTLSEILSAQEKDDEPVS